MLYPVLQDPLHPIVSSLFDRPRGASIGQMLFGAGEQGGWYDVSDMSTLFQDAAGTTPVTAVEQPVGRILDKSGRGNHAAQATTTKRPVLSQRYNLSSRSATPDGWVAEGTTPPTVANNQTYIGESCGAITFDPAAPAGFAGSRARCVNSSGPVVASRNYGGSFRVALSRPLTGAEGIEIRLTGSAGLGLFPLVAANSEELVNGFKWFHVNIASAVASGSVQPYVSKKNINSPITVYVSAWSLYNEIDYHFPYQWVNTATDYDADPAKFPAYLRFDGVDDALQTGNIDFTSTDKMTVWAGVTKLSDAAAGIVAELSPSQATNIGSFYLAAPYIAAPNVGFLACGTINTSTPAADNTWAAPASLVATGQGLIGWATPNILRTTGKPELNVGNSIGTGNYGNYQLYIGARAGTSLYFNGRLYSLIVCGAQSSLSEIEVTELYIKQKMRMP